MPVNARMLTITRPAFTHALVAAVRCRYGVTEDLQSFPRPECSQYWVRDMAGIKRRGGLV